MTKKLINKSAALLEERGFNQVTSAQDRQKDSGGITHTVFRHDDSGEMFHVRAKAEVYKGRAPFGKGMVGHALEKDAMLVIYYDETERFFVADPGYVRDEGEAVDGISKRSDDPRTYLEIALDDCCRLHAYVSGQRTPRQPEAQATHRGLDEFC